MKRLLLPCFVLLIAASANAQLTKDQANARKSDSDVASSQVNTEVISSVSTRDTRRAARIDARKTKQQAKIDNVAIGGGISPEKEKRNRGRKYYIDVNGTKTYVDNQD